MKQNFQSTIRACFFGYIIQAIVNNYVPLLFVTFEAQYGIPLSQITALITINFILQLGVDLASTLFVDKIGYRKSMLLAHFFAAAGLISLAILPDVCGNPFVGILISVVMYAIGGGLLEVVVSPLVEACPNDHKDRTMSMLHSFYCWGSAGVIIVSTLFFNIFGIANWRILAAILALVPIFNGIAFTRVLIATLEDEGDNTPLATMLKQKMFWVFVILMFCAGASELAVSQWASAFAEKALGLSKSVSDLAGPTLFAVFMGASRVVYGKYGEKIDLDDMMLASGALCIVSYLITSLSANPVFGLVGIALAGFSVGIMWPGTYSKASGAISGGTAMFALLALAGDLGCSMGPTLAGKIASMFGDNLKIGILTAIVFPVLLTGIMIALKRKHA